MPLAGGYIPPRAPTNAYTDLRTHLTRVEIQLRETKMQNDQLKIMIQELRKRIEELIRENEELSNRTTQKETAEPQNPFDDPFSGEAETPENENCNIENRVEGLTNQLKIQNHNLRTRIEELERENEEVKLRIAIYQKVDMQNAAWSADELVVRLAHCVRDREERIQVLMERLELLGDIPKGRKH